MRDRILSYLWGSYEYEAQPREVDEIVANLPIATLQDNTLEKVCDRWMENNKRLAWA